MYEITNSDWKKYREKIGIWQENYMERLLKEYVDFSDDLQEAVNNIVNH